MSIVVFAFILIAVAGHAQSTATLSGNITDPSGAVVPGAQVTVHGIATGLDRVVTSDSAGNYTVPSLLPGNYSVSVQASGFSTYKLTSVSLGVDQTVTANVHLSVAAAGEVVNVQGAAPIIDAGTITVAQETLVFRRQGISPYLRLLVPTFLLPHAPPWLTPLASLLEWNTLLPLHRTF